MHVWNLRGTVPPAGLGTTVLDILSMIPTLLKKVPECKLWALCIQNTAQNFALCMPSSTFFAVHSQ